ncbi:DUF4199 domain-containing protein [Flagellimonas hymeniacidonis]|uniref:DUF4199 domain-containing protein n=1 Tax=Flagellimonas hymeniacidonis TaxID=2603628 RepID=A0A5C8V7I0_9FLAO|nr:DUF4199 domain-containing protein [Flagellimonas hymeniacidonis]TXN37323.1 DUF4199 domain-containing protein [Flagellimonas hymeniacidonis]
MKKTVLRFGLYGALTICILFLTSWYLLNDLSFSTQEVLGYVSMVLSLGFVYFGIKHFRDKENAGKIRFKKALIIGILISLITAVAFGALDVLFTEVLNPDFMVEYYDATVESMRNAMAPDEFKVKLAELEAQKEMFSNPIFSFGLMAMTVFVIGFIISLISALILQRK